MLLLRYGSPRVALRCCKGCTPGVPVVTIYVLSHINTVVPYVTSELSVQKNAPVGDSSEKLPAAGEVCS